MLSLVLRTLAYFRNLHIPVGVGVAIASAVMVGALVVGDSMRASLRFIAMDRIGDIDHVLLAPRWFPEALSENLVRNGIKADRVHSALFVQQAIAEKDKLRANELSLLGVDDTFWKLAKLEASPVLGDEQVALNATLAEKLQAKVGDQITLRIASQAVVPAESPLGKREQDWVVLPRWKVVAVLPDASLARFSLRSDQRPIMNAFANKSSLQKHLEIERRVNALFIARSPDGAQDSQSFLETLSPSLEDAGLRWTRVERNYPDPKLDLVGGNTIESPNSSSKRVLDYHHLTTDQMMILENLAVPILRETNKLQPIPVLTYLANSTQVVTSEKNAKRVVPYSTISAVDWNLISTYLASSGKTAPANPNTENWTVVHQWMADELGAEVGDRLRIAYYLPETVDGKEVEATVDVTVVAIAPITEPKDTGRVRRGTVRFRYEQPPTPFNDSAWTPDVPGITDQDSISKWDTPFPLNEKLILEQDDTYWNAHGLTPKLFVSYDLGKKLFGSRFGNTTSIRYNDLDSSQAKDIEQTIQKIVALNLNALGWRAIPVRQQQLKAASGTTPFDALFMSLSFFVIVAALLLVAILFRLTIDQRANHWGLLLATGWTRTAVRKLLLLEGSIVSLIGSALGVVLGLGYAYAMISGLRSWWIGAITVSFLNYHANVLSLVLGWLLGAIAAIVTILFASSQLKRVSVARLLKKQWEMAAPAAMEVRGGRTKKWPIQIWCMAACLATAVTALVAGQFLQGQAQAGAFVGSGMLLLIAGLIWTYQHLQLDVHSRSPLPPGTGACVDDSSLASSNAKRAPVRSILAIGLVSVASFLILSMSLFQAAPTVLGTGGFAFVGKSTQPIYKDLGSREVQRDMLGSKSDSLENIEVVSLRLRGGDDASCNNLFQASEPQVLGVSPRINQVDRDGRGKSAFGWFASGATAPDETAWKLLEESGSGGQSSPIPVIIDQNTALWALHLAGYVGEQFHYRFDDREVYFRTVGVLQNTILQGSLIIGEKNFEGLFPSITGHRMFLIKDKRPEASIDSPQRVVANLHSEKNPSEKSLLTEKSPNMSASLEHIRELMEDGWSESGLSLANSSDILKQLLAVQNTYLSAFQVLGALGLLLGTIGLGIAQLRSALERRGELATMRAIGFTKSRLVWLLTLENIWQLIRGIGIGVGTAVLATLPAIASGQPFAGLLWPMMMLGMVILCGLVCSVVVAYIAMRWPLLQALRADR